MRNKYFYQSFYADFRLGKRINYVLEWTVNNEDDDHFQTGSYGINNELFYKLNDCWTVGARLEWMHTYSGNYRGKTFDDKFVVTFGANWEPTNWLTFRPEIRYDEFVEEKKFNESASISGDPRHSARFPAAFP